MKVQAPHHILLALLGIIALVLTGCGGNEDMAKKMGCPGDSIMANSDDVVVIRTAEPSGLKFGAGPIAAAFGIVYPDPMASGGWTFPYSGNYGPIVVEVWEPTGGFRKNNICVVLNSDGYFWDENYTAVLGLASLGWSRYVTKTDISGVATVWWSTGVVASSLTASGTVNGADVSYGDTITASSGGATQAFWDAGYSVTGCLVGAVCP